MRDLAQAVGCDESMISKIEAGKVMPSLPMLNKIGPRSRPGHGIVSSVSRSTSTSWCRSRRNRAQGAGRRAARGTGVTYERLVPVAAGNLLEANVHVVAPGARKSTFTPTRAKRSATSCPAPSN